MPIAIFAGKLNPDVSMASFESWVSGFDYPRVARIPSVLSHQINVVVEDLPPSSNLRFDYVEVIEFSNLASYLQDLSKNQWANEISRELGEYIDLKSVAAVHGRLIPSCRPGWGYGLTPVIMLAKRKRGKTENDQAKWVCEIEQPLIQQVKSIEMSCSYTLRETLPIFGSAPVVFDHANIAFVSSLSDLRQELSSLLGPQTIMQQFSSIFDVPVLFYSICKFVPPGVNRLHEYAKYFSHQQNSI